MPRHVVLMQFDCGTRILRVIPGRDARATFANCITTRHVVAKCLQHSGFLFVSELRRSLMFSAPVNGLRITRGLRLL